MPNARALQPPQTFSPVFHRWSANLSFKPHLNDIALANVLAGDTCDPISLSDFEGYLAYREHSLENLQFVVWFQDYNKRFLAHSQGAKSDLDERRLSAPSRASVERRAAQSLASPIRIAEHERSASREWPDSPDDVVLEPFRVASADPAPPPNEDREEVDLEDINFTSIPGLEDDPFKKESMRVIATFLRPGAKKELSLDAMVRDTAIRELAHDTHPNVFLPIYREVYEMLESGSLRRFLLHNSANINLPKQLFWYGVGLTDLLIGIVITVSLTTNVPTPPQGNRAWRLFAIIFIWFGSMQTYSAWRGFCSQVYGRGNVQLRVWEMQDVDEEEKLFWSRLLVDDDELSLVFGKPGVTVPDIMNVHHRHSKKSPSALPVKSPTVTGFNRPAIFGPEKVVLDVHIKAVHQQVMNEILRLGVIVAVAYAAVTLALPSLHLRR